MVIVNIYIFQSIKGPGTKPGAYTYILETDKDGNIVTLTDSGKLEPMTEKKAELVVLLKALKRLRKKCEVHVFGVSMAMKIGFEVWIDRWIEAEWKNAKGKEVANKEEWQQLLEFKNTYEITLSEFSGHSYMNWMQQEARKKVENGD